MEEENTEQEPRPTNRALESIEDIYLFLKDITHGNTY